MSYLAEQKASIAALVDALQEELSKVESAEEIPGVFEEFKKALWPTVESMLKQSFKNGQQMRLAKGDNGGEEPRPKSRFAAWRKPQGGA
jgi:hypothetical protein